MSDKKEVKDNKVNNTEPKKSVINKTKDKVKEQAKDKVKDKSSEKSDSKKTKSSSKAVAKKAKKKHYMSAKSFIFICITVLVLLCAVIFAVGIYHAYQMRVKYSLIEDVSDKCTVIGSQILWHSFDIDGDDTSLDTDLNQIARIYDGRIIVVDRDYKVIKDTFSYMEGKYIISDDVMTVMTAKSKKVADKDKDSVSVIAPITDKGGSIVGVIIFTASLESLNETKSYMFIVALILLFIVVIIGVLFGTVIAHVSFRDVDNLNKNMLTRRNGSEAFVVPDDGFVETRALAENFNQILKKLDAIDSTRQDFVSNVSHELKTPVTSMKVLAESVLQNEGATVEVYKDFMNDIVAELDRETKIINDLLVLVKNDKQSAKLNIEETDINNTLDVILKRVTPIAGTRNIELIYESYKEVKAEVDEVKLSLAISNLIENAIKYNLDNGWVKVSLNADSKYFYLKVADSGVGIPDDCKDMVFERFYRVDKARSRDTGGTGLGLAISKSAINLHHGTIKLYSESGRGTTFTVKIPLKYEDTKSEA